MGTTNEEKKPNIATTACIVNTKGSTHNALCPLLTLPGVSVRRSDVVRAKAMHPLHPGVN